MQNKPGSRTSASPTMSDWASTALWMLEIRKTGSWKDCGAASLTDFVHTFANRNNKTPFVYWRGLAAAEFYLDFQKGHPHMKLPSLETLGRVSPENLELLAKISRRTSDDTTCELMLDLINRKIGRTRLKETWEIYRETTDFPEEKLLIEDRRPMRIVQRTTQRFAETAKSRAEANIIARLLEQGWTWCADSEPGIYKFFPHVRIPTFQLGTSISKAIDAVGVVAMVGGTIDLHGVFVSRNIKSEILTRLPDLMTYQPYLDQTWLAILGKIDPHFLGKIPQHIGIIEIRPETAEDRNEIGVIDRGQPDKVEARLKVNKGSLRSAPVYRVRAPSPTVSDGVNSGAVAKILLTRN